MFQHLLVPLDGSRLAESALPAAACLAQTLGASVTLIHIIEHDAPVEIHSDRHLADPDEAIAYLKVVASQAFPTNVPVEWHVHTVEVKDVPRSIVEHAEELSPDLIVMCTHGRSGPRDWFFGSVAQQVMAVGNVPVLLTPSRISDTICFPSQRAVVTLDGAPEHEQGLPVATGLAKTIGMALHLLMVIPTLATLKGESVAVATMLPGAMRTYLDLAEQGGKDYLARHLAGMREAGLEVSAEVQRGDPVSVIVKTVQRLSADLIIMGTHGKTGMDAFWSGSVTPRVSGRSRVPLLLVPVGEK